MAPVPLFALLWCAVVGDPMRVVVRVAAPGDELLLARIRGQVNDLEVQMSVERGRLEDDVPSQVDAATALAEARQARVVIWFRHPAAGGVVVHIADPSERALLTRWLEVPRGGNLERSARAEAVALIVRMALRALAAGGKIGVTQPEPVAAPEPQPEPVRVETKPERTWSFAAAAGWSAVVDGAREPVQQGLAVEVGIETARARWGLEGIAGLPLTIADGRTSVDVTRHAAGVRGDWLLVRSPLARVAVFGSLGAVAFARSAAVALSPDIAPAPAQTTIAFYASPGVAADWRPMARAPLWLQLTLAADVVAGAPELGYVRDGVFAATDRFWPVQPRAVASLVFREK